MTKTHWVLVAGYCVGLMVGLIGAPMWGAAMAAVIFSIFGGKLEAWLNSRALRDCAPDIYSKGKVIGIMASLPSEAIELIVRRMAQDSKQPIDWHWFAGRAVIKTTGDVREAQMQLPIVQKMEEST